MNAITNIIAETQNFDFHTAQVRVVNLNGEPWFVAKDVCDILGLTNSRKAVAALDDDEKDVTTGYTLGGKQALNIISESGLYALIFQSRKPEAKAFRKWVTSTVLPAIRQTGSYVAGEERLDPNAPDYLDRLKDLLIEAKERKLAEAEAKLAEQAPKVADYDTRWERKDTIGLSEYAKQAGLKPNKFTAALRDMGYLYNRQGTNNIPYAAHVGTLFVRKDTPAGFGQTYLTQEGCAHFTSMVNGGTFDKIKR
ncbi:BRO family protein [Sulfitobacter sp.]|uniref:BRO family protein n=1 Tax=Sulfitobacter sp. TaxID=1903071 RepID=UPI003296EDE2